MRLRSPIDAHEPVAFILPSKAPGWRGAAAMFAIPCTGVRYWRSKAQTPHGAFTAAAHRGIGAPRCSRHRGCLVAPDGSARSKITAIESSVHGSKHFAS